MTLSNFISKMMVFTTIAILSLSVASCTDIESLEDSDLEDAIRAKLEYTCFDFSTTTTIPVKLDVGRMALVRIYDGDPQTDTKAQQLLTVYTDDYGYWEGKMSISKANLNHTLYAIAADIKTSGKITNNSITLTSNQWQTRGINSLPASRVGENTTQDKSWCQLWSAYYRDHLVEGQNNTSKITKVSNTDLKLTAETEVNVSFLYSGANIPARVYYYYYPTAKPLDIVSIYKIFHNETFQLFKTCGKDSNGYITDDVKVNYEDVGTNQNLVYYGTPTINADGSVTFTQTGSLKFPEGYSVGFFITSDYDDCYPPFCTNNALNSFSYNAMDEGKYRPFLEMAWDTDAYKGTDDLETNVVQAARFLTTDANTFIYGIEDLPATEEFKTRVDNETIIGYGGGADLDFNDVIIAVSAYPNLPKEEEDKTIDSWTEGTTLSGTLLFEDLYPSQGDYDMNDVVMEFLYTAYLRKETVNNETLARIVAITCDFIPYHDGATYRNDFCIRWKDDNTRISTVFINHKENMNKTSSVTLMFAGNNALEQSEFILDNFDPFIKVQNTGYEVHLTDKSPTNQMSTTLLNNLSEAAKAYYSLGADGDQVKYPYAMMIPYTSKQDPQEKNRKFIPVNESVRIELEYSDYLNWVDTKGEGYKEWYLPDKHQDYCPE